MKNLSKSAVLSGWMLMFLSIQSFSQSYPSYGPEIKVTVTGLTFDAMEPFISSDGGTLFFNSINSGGNTNLYYALKVNDSTFNYVGMVNGSYNPAANHLDAVASMDSANHFFWVSNKNYPNVFENLHRGNYSSGNVTDTTRVYGDFNIKTLGWIIMDAAINYRGDQLYYCNAYFDFVNNSCGGTPCKARLGVAQRVNDSTFNKLPNTDGIFSNINDTNYLVYAPQLSNDGKELYFTRLLRGAFNTELCVSVRNTPADTFSIPKVIYSNPGFVPEAITITGDKQKIYYHQKNNSGLFRIFLRYRTGTVGVNPLKDEQYSVRMTTANGKLYLSGPITTWHFETEIYSVNGQLLLSSCDETIIELSEISTSLCIVKILTKDHIRVEKIVIR